MRAVDTNILVRLLVRDDVKQAESAERFIAKGAWVSQLVLAETMWVLDVVYDRTAAQIAFALKKPLQDADMRARPGRSRSEPSISDI